MRKDDEDTLIIADGFSCREQIGQTTDREALHLAQVIQMALHEGPRGPSDGLPEAWAARDGDAGRMDGRRRRRCWGRRGGRRA